MSTSSSSSSGVSALSLLGVVFVTLKLMGYINWSWWWVTAPFWIPATIGLVFMAIGMGIGLYVMFRSNG